MTRDHSAPRVPTADCWSAEVLQAYRLKKYHHLQHLLEGAGGSLNVSHHIVHHISGSRRLPGLHVCGLRNPRLLHKKSGQAGRRRRGLRNGFDTVSESVTSK